LRPRTPAKSLGSGGAGKKKKKTKTGWVKKVQERGAKVTGWLASHGAIWG